MNKKVFSYGNTKLPKTTGIFNLCPQKDCPSNKLGLCDISNKCYAKKAERLYPQVLPFRNRQKRFWLKIRSLYLKNEQKAIDTFLNRFYTDTPTKKLRYQLKALRFNESGDFSDQLDISIMESIAKELAYSDKKTYTYTHRIDLDFSKCKYLTVSGSGFMVHNEFNTVPKKSQLKGIYCPMDCKKCSLCLKPDHKTILCRLH